MIQIRGQNGLLWKILPFVKLAFYAIGSGWNHFYGWMIDRQEAKNTIETILKRGKEKYSPGKDKGLYDLSRGEYHAEYLRRHGLKAHHTVLDIGCGFGRTGIPLLRYLDPAKYIGVEISAERLRIAREWTEHENLQAKEPRWLVEFDNDLLYLEDGTVDYIWAQSVLTHMPMKEIRKLLAAAHRVLSPNGAFLFNFTVSEGQSNHCSNVKDYQYPPDVIDGLLEEYGYTVEKMPDWQDDLEEEYRASQNIMIKATKRRGSP